MRKLTSFLMLWLLCLSSSMQAQTTFYKPGKRLDMTNDAVAVGSYVFIYSMYVHTENETTTNDSRFIVNNGNNNATVYNIAPNAFITNNTDHIWKIASKEIVGEGDAQAVLITLQRRMGADNKYFGIGSLTNNDKDEVAQKFYLRQWTKNAYHSGVTKATSKQCADDGTTYSEITASDNVYVVSANNKAMSTSGGTYNGSGTVGTPIVFYAAEAIDPAAVTSTINISPAPSNGAWASGTTWYKIKQNNSSYWSTNAAYTTSNGYIKLSNTETPTDAKALWCVTGNADDGFSFYNLAEGTSAKFATSGTAGGAVSHVTTSPTGSEVTLFDILQFPGTTSFYIRNHGTANNFLNLRDGYLAHWDSALGMGNDGSKIEFEAVSADDVLEVVSATKTQMLKRLTDWNNISAIGDFSAIYDELNASTARDAMGILAAVSKAQTDFAAAVNGKHVKLTICESNTSHNRYGRVLALDATQAHGKQPVQTADEIITLKANRDATVNLYNEYYNKYVAALGTGTATAATAEDAGNFYLQISSNTTSAVQNVAAFKTKENDMLHMSGNGDCPLMNYVNDNNFDDGASRWKFALINDADFAKLELSWAINEATSVLNGMQSFITSHTADLASTTSSCLTSLTSAIADATTVANTSSSEASVYTTAQSTLATALRAARQGFFASLGETRYYLKLNTTSLYMKVGCLVNDRNEGNAQLASLTEGSVEQSFSLVAGSGENANKIYLQTDGRQLKNLGDWNTEMAAAGTAYLFEDTDIAAGIVRICNIANERDENKKYLGTNSGGTAAGAHVFTNKASGDPTEWVLVPVSKASVRLALAAAYEQIKAWYDANSTKALNSTDQVWSTLSSALTTAETQASESNLESNTIAGIAAAHDALIEAYDAVVASYQSNTSQKFRMRLHSTAHGDNRYMQVLGTEVKQISVSLDPIPESKRVFTMQKAGDYFHILNGTNTLQYSATESDYWNVKFAEGTASNWKITRPVGQWSRFYIRKEIANNVFFSPHNTQEADGSYLVFSNIGDRNTWEFELLANDDEVSETNTYMQRALALYEQYLPYYGIHTALYDADKAGLPGYPTDASKMFDQTFDALVLKLAHPSGIEEHDVLTWEYTLPYMVPVLANYPTNRYFIIHNNDNRGDVYYYNATAADGTTGEGLSAAYLWSTGKSGATLDKGDATYQWCFLPHEKEDGSTEYYLYNVGKKQYARPTKKDDHPGKYCWVFTDEPAPVTLTWRTGHELYITAQSMEDDTPKDVYMSMSNNYTGPLTAHTDDNLTDGGLRFTFDWATPTEVDADVTSAVTALVQNDVELTTIGSTSLITGLTGEQTTIRTFSST